MSASKEPRKSADWEAIESRYPDSELGVERLAFSIISHRPCDIAAEMGWPPIVSIARQVRLGRGIADIVLEHSDRSVSLIEVKGFGLGLRDYCTGIGQLAYQAILAMAFYQTCSVRRVLALPGPIPVDVILACHCAEADILPLPTPAQWRGFLDEASKQAA